MDRSAVWPLGVLTVVLVALAGCKVPPPPPLPKTGERPPVAVAAEAERAREALQAATEAYVYGYPLVSAELARRVATSVEAPTGAQAPMGQLARFRSMETPAGTRWRGSVDTLQVEAWLDVADGPWVLFIPEARGRFQTVTIRSAWNDLLDVSGGKGARGRAARIAVASTGWAGKPPAGLRLVRSPTALVRVEGRVLAVGGPNDRSEARGWLERISLLPLGAGPKRSAPTPGRPEAAIDVATPVRDQVHALDAVTYFKLLATLLKANPPAPGDATILPALAHIGLVAGRDYDPTGLDASVLKALAGAPRVAQGEILAAAGSAAAVNGWTVAGAVAAAPGFLGRAATVAAGFDRVLEGVVLTAEVDGSGRPLDGATGHALRFTRGKGPPAEVLWSLTAYDERGAPVDEKAGHGQLTSRSKLQYGGDGSLELLLQAAPPAGREANWLQVPEGRYAVVLRLHGPRERAPSVLDGSWKPPAIGKAR
jgi:hypothetical protein